ncbi:MAG: hypothetical protein HQL63_15275 [Magnetococcales bacterium]|nr:hypothetical protein [Magnetococcales bacterium]
MAMDFGIAWDEPEHWAQGHRVLAFFTSLFQDRQAVNPDFATSYYGGHVHVVSALLERLLELDAYHTSRLWLPLLGMLGVAGVWRLTRYIGGEQAGFWAAILLLLMPRYFGHVFINPKDMPFAVGYVWSLYHLIRIADVYPSIPAKLAIRTGMVLGVTLGMRTFGGLLWIILPLLLFYKQWLVSGQAAVKSFGDTLIKNKFPIFLLALFSCVFCVLLWPSALVSPVQTLGHTLSMAAKFSHDYTVFMFGEAYRSSDLPLSYLPIHFGIELPEISLVLLLAAVPFALHRLFITRDGRENSEIVGYAGLLAGLLVPLLFVVIFRPSIYNGTRHFLFLLPPMAALQALLLVSMLSWLRRRGRKFLATLSVWIVVLALFTQVARMWLLHPIEYSFYNALIGGLHGAYNRFTIDYWLLSHKPAIENLSATINAHPGMTPRAGVGKPFKIFVCPFPDIVAPFLGKHLTTTRNALDADFILLQSARHCVTYYWIDDEKYSGVKQVAKNLHRVKVKTFEYAQTMGIPTSVILSVEPKSDWEVCIASDRESSAEIVWRKDAELRNICNP